MSAITATVDLGSLAKLTEKLQRVGRSLPQVAGAVLFREAETIMTAAKGRTPVLTGALRASGKTLLPEITATGAAVMLGFGDAAVKYAIFVHENLQAHHANGEAKFLERSVDEARSSMEDRLRRGIAAEIDRLAKA